MDEETRAGCLHPCSKGAEWQCECHRRMGNEFWFLPIGSCLDAPTTDQSDIRAEKMKARNE